MALSLRSRLGRRTAEGDQKHSADEQVISSGDSASSQENLQPKSTDKKNTKGYKVIAKTDMSTTPPPSDRKLRSNTEKSNRNVSPSQSLLDRYKNRSAAAQISTTAKGTMSPSRPAKTALTKPGKDTAFRESFEMSSLEPSDTLNEHHDDLPSDMEVIEGVEFEMMGKKGRTGQPPAEDTVPLLPPRSTRSQVRRQHRADSVNSRVENKGSLIPPALSICKPGHRELPRTPSPRTAATDEVIDSDSLKSPHVRTTPSPGLVERAKNVSLPKLSPASDVPRKSSMRKTTTLLNSVLVHPPAPNPLTSAAFIWVSGLSSSSRPTDPWGWMKKWTCCQCALLDPRKMGKAAQTMVEQNVCSRLECGHERCAAGCRVYTG